MTEVEIVTQEQALALTAQEFYKALVNRNSGILTLQDQENIKQATILVAGVGSTGGATLDPLVRTGVTKFILAEPGNYELTNLNRQTTTLECLGENKAQAQAVHIQKINPHAEVEVHNFGVTPENFLELTAQASVIIDAIDVTTLDGLEAKKLLHIGACRNRIPTVCAYDIAGTQHIQIFDYRKKNDRKRNLARKLANMTDVNETLAKLIPPRVLPLEILAELEQRAADSSTDRPFPQIAATSTLLGALVIPVVLNLLGNKPVKRYITVDIYNEMRTPVEKLSAGIAKVGKIYRLRKIYKGAGGA